MQKVLEIWLSHVDESKPLSTTAQGLKALQDDSLTMCIWMDCVIMRNADIKLATLTQFKWGSFLRGFVKKVCEVQV